MADQSPYDRLGAVFAIAALIDHSPGRPGSDDLLVGTQQDRRADDDRWSRTGRRDHSWDPTEKKTGAEPHRTCRKRLTG